MKTTFQISNSNFGVNHPYITFVFELDEVRVNAVYPGYTAFVNIADGLDVDDWSQVLTSMQMNSGDDRLTVIGTTWDQLMSNVVLQLVNACNVIYMIENPPVV